MKRRTFIRKNGQITLLAPLFPVSLPNFFVGRDVPDEKPDWLKKMIANNDASLERVQERYVENPDSPNHGTVLDGYDMASPHAATSFLKTGICALISSESKYHADSGLVERLGNTAEFLLGLQHDDGTIDLLSTNFHSTPDTGFIVKWLAPVWRLLENSNIPEKSKISLPLKRFLMQAGEALKVGGIHTPNHRWVVCSALAELYKIEKDPGYIARASSLVISVYRKVGSLRQLKD